MKKIALTVGLLILGTKTMAQTEKGRWLLGTQVGNFAYRKLAYESGHVLNLDLMPATGYFLANNLLVALRVPYQVEKTNSEYVAGDKLHRQIGIGPSVRYYIGKAKARPFVGFGYFYQWGKERRTYIITTENVVVDKFFIRTWSPNVGVSYFIHRNVALNAGLSYNWEAVEGYSTSTLYPDPGNSDYYFRWRSVTVDAGFFVLLGKATKSP